MIYDRQGVIIMAKQTCPYCGSQNIAEYLYGYPDLDDEELEKQIENVRNSLCSNICGLIIIY